MKASRTLWLGDMVGQHFCLYTEEGACLTESEAHLTGEGNSSRAQRCGLCVSRLGFQCQQCVSTKGCSAFMPKGGGDRCHGPTLLSPVRALYVCCSQRSRQK